MKKKEGVGLTTQIIREVGIMKSLRHPNIVDLLAIECKKGNIFLVMEMLQGDLSHYLEN